MARAGRPRKRPVNDNQPAPKPAPSENQTHEDGDDCRDALMAMPDVGALDFTAQFTVWALRSWVHAFKAKLSFDAVTHQTLARFGLSRAAVAIDGLMTVLAASASRSIDIRCVQCRLLSPDEALLIERLPSV